MFSPGVDAQSSVRFYRLIEMHVHNAAYNPDGDIPNANLGTFDPASGMHNGFKETPYGSVFYRFLKRTELYRAGNCMRLHDDFTVGSTLGSNNQVEVTGSIRTRFRERASKDCSSSTGSGLATRMGVCPAGLFSFCTNQMWVQRPVSRVSAHHRSRSDARR